MELLPFGKFLDSLFQRFWPEMYHSCKTRKQCSSIGSIEVEEIFLDAGFEAGTYLNLSLKSDDIEAIVEHPMIKAVSLTGSEKQDLLSLLLLEKTLKIRFRRIGRKQCFHRYE